MGLQPSPRHFRDTAIKRALLATPALTVVLMLAAGSQASWSANQTARIEGPAAQQLAVSSARKSSRRPRVHVQQAPAPVTPFRWRPADPSFDQQGRLYRPPPGLPCPIDLGYGRWTSCSNR